MEHKTKVKCNCCNQTQFFRDNEKIYIKCVRCKTVHSVKLNDIIEKSSELTTEPKGL
jgi:uncharacterized protein YifN (PemK superfamily)